ncbi:MAG: hypothetical protein GX575_06400 [Candidatus Anammoximicrobium sp.]|nr:hypothetical protein [Candidatus Anammoximicrobium sp.]
MLFNVDTEVEEVTIILVGEKRGNSLLLCGQEPKTARGGAAAGAEHGSTLPSSVVAEEVAGRGDGWC